MPKAFWPDHDNVSVATVTSGCLDMPGSHLIAQHVTARQHIEDCCRAAKQLSLAKLNAKGSTKHALLLATCSVLATLAAGRRAEALKLGTALGSLRILLLRWQLAGCP